MEDLFVNKLEIYGNSTTYPLYVNSDWGFINAEIVRCSFIVMDRNVFNLHSQNLVLDESKVLLIDVSEKMKTPETALFICEKLIESDVNRDGLLGAIGGGIIQDLVTFAASFYMRGIEWIYIPTTLLSQSDSCIGGKSSINFKKSKNILGNFYNPSKIIVQPKFLISLDETEIRSGIGEILKVFLLSGPKAIDDLKNRLKLYYEKESDIDDLILKALNFKNEILKIDALDKGPRLKMNYGHSFGHAIEAATNFKIAHGIAITIGIDMANFFAFRKGLLNEKVFHEIRDLLFLNLKPKDFIDFQIDDFINALKKDKKNKTGEYGLIIPISRGEVELQFHDMKLDVYDIVKNYKDEFYGIKN